MKTKNRKRYLCPHCCVNDPTAWFRWRKQRARHIRRHGRFRLGGQVITMGGYHNCVWLTTAGWSETCNHDPLANARRR